MWLVQFGQIKTLYSDNCGELFRRPNACHLDFQSEGCSPEREPMVCFYTIGIQNVGTRMCKLFTCVNCRRETIVMFGRCENSLGISRIWVSKFIDTVYLFSYMWLSDKITRTANFKSRICVTSKLPTNVR